MSAVRDFVLSRRASVDLGILTSRDHIGAASCLAGRREMVGGDCSMSIDLLHVPVVNIGHYGIGLVYAIVGGGDGEGGNMVKRAGADMIHCGRFCRDERTGETVHVMSDLRGHQLETVTLMWLGGAGRDSRARERMDFLCDATLFATGRIVQSVFRCEHTVRVNSQDSPLSVVPSHGTDFSQAGNNMAFYGGRSEEFLVSKGGGGGELTLYGSVAVETGKPLYSENFSGEDFEDDSVRSARFNILRAVTQVKLTMIDPLVLRCWPFARLLSTLVDFETERVRRDTESGTPDSDFAANDFSPGGCLAVGAGSAAVGNGVENLRVIDSDAVWFSDDSSWDASVEESARAYKL